MDYISHYLIKCEDAEVELICLMCVVGVCFVVLLVIVRLCLVSVLCFFFWGGMYVE